VGFVDAALGARVQVPTLDEPIDMDVPKGTQPGAVFTLKGLGLPHLGSAHKGDLLVEVRVATPTSLTRKQEELLKEFQALEAKKPLKKVKSFFKKAGKAMSG
jgi:molecular chaperone DnaJ